MSKYFGKDKWFSMLRTIFHPMDEFYWIRHRENRGSVPLAILMVFIFSCCFTANRLLSSFVVNDIDARTVDSLFELIGVLVFYLLLCVSNWSITCLIAVGYSTVPISFILMVATIVSRFIADDEQAFYSIILVVGVAYGIIMMIIGIMQVHNYTLGKTLLTVFLTFVALLIIVFLILLLTNLIGMVFNFFKSIYTELIFRT